MSDVITKDRFIARLRWFAANRGAGLPDEYGHPDYSPSRGEATLAGLFARWLAEENVPEDPHESWTSHIPRLVVAAYADFAAAPQWTEARDAYERETQHSLPDLVDAHAGGLHRVLVAQSVARLMPLLAGAPWVRAELEAMLGAQQMVIDHAWQRFVRVAYRKLMPRIRGERHRGNVGVFGSTKLMTWACAGRVMFTFERTLGQMTYVADEGDAYGLRSGPNAPGAPYTECVAMIEDVIAHWDIDKLQRSDTVGIGVLGP
jgi:hypothetical protein